MQALAELALRGGARAAQIAVDVGGERVCSEVVGDGTTPHTRFLLFSLSKPLTAATVLTLVDAGELTLDTRVSSVLPAFGANGKQDVTLAQVMDHTAGFPTRLGPEHGHRELGFEDLTDWEEQVALICGMPLEPSLVGIPIYHGLSFGILGAVVEAVSGTDFRSYCSAALLEPTAMSGTTFGLPPEHRGDAAPLDGGPELFFDALVPAGNAFSTADDLSRFFSMLRAGGAVDGRQVLSAAVVSAATTPHGASGIFDFGYGFFLCGTQGRVFARGTRTAPGTFGHSGAHATQAFHDPSADLTFVGLTGPGLPTQEASDARFDALCDWVYDELAQHA